MGAPYSARPVNVNVGPLPPVISAAYARLINLYSESRFRVPRHIKVGLGSGLERHV